MTDIGVGGVTRTVARASDLSGARRTEFLLRRFAVERRRRFSRRRRTVAVAVVAARHRNLQRYAVYRHAPVAAHTQSPEHVCARPTRSQEGPQAGADSTDSTANFGKTLIFNIVLCFSRIKYYIDDCLLISFDPAKPHIFILEICY